MSHQVLIVDDEPRYRQLYAQVLSGAGLEVREADSAESARASISAQPPELVVSDVRMPGASGLDLLASVRRELPGLPFLLVTAYADVRDAVSALKLGAVDYLAKPVDLDELVASVQDALGIIPAHRQEEDPPPEALAKLVAVSPELRELLRDAWRVAKSDANVLITGESGTGKEVLARFLYENSPRARGPFVAVNCAALPGGLLASELFGHVKGAFTGATEDRAGRFREAEGGVLFLDEIGDMPSDLQAVLLRVLEERRVSPLGGSGEVAVDFRLLAATNCALAEAVEAGRFRSDLYYRLNVIELQLPPLRARRQDILPLARRFLQRQDGPNKRISRAAARILEGYGWPGNVRELDNTMQRARLLSRTDVILPDNLPPALRRAADAVEGALEDNGATLKEIEIDSLKRALLATEGNRTKAAERLGISRRGLLKKMKRFGLS